MGVVFRIECPLNACKTQTDGWYTHRRRDQTLILYGILVIGVLCIHAAPNCALWGNTAANLRLEVLTARREKEKPGLQCLALLCFVQVLMGRNFVIESSGASKIIKESPLQVLVQLGLHVTKLDQCMYGAEQENQRIRKNTMFVSDCPPSFQVL